MVLSMALRAGEWWVVLDSNQGSRRRRIYSLEQIKPHLQTTR